MQARELKTLNLPNEILVVHVGENPPEQFKADLVLPAGIDPKEAAEKVYQLMSRYQILEYFI